MEKDTKLAGEITLDKDTAGKLKALITQINQLGGRYNLIIGTYLSAKGKKGVYGLSKDGKKLVEMKKEGEK